MHKNIRLGSFLAEPYCNVCIDSYSLQRQQGRAIAVVWSWRHHHHRYPLCFPKGTEEANVGGPSFHLFPIPAASTAALAVVVGSKSKTTHSVDGRSFVVVVCFSLIAVIDFLPLQSNCGKENAAFYCTFIYSNLILTNFPLNYVAHIHKHGGKPT